ncbi:MAG: hypothetical protein ABJN26_06120 [Stappiaceae bacterium]
MTYKKSISNGSIAVAEVLSAFGVPGGSIVGKLASNYIAAREKEAIDIFIEETSERGFHGAFVLAEDEVPVFVDMIYRFTKAVDHGTAMENLRLLAQTIAGMQKQEILSGDGFRRWSSILEQLTRDELFLIGAGYQIIKYADGKPEFWKELAAKMKSVKFEHEEIAAIAASVSRTGLLLPASAWGGITYRPSPWLTELGKLADLEATTNGQAEGHNSSQSY